MKNRVSIIKKLFGAALTAAVLTGAIFAQISATDKTQKNNRQDVRQYKITATSRKNFNLGSRFVSAMKNAEYLERNENAAKSAIVDIVYLIDALGNQPESAALQKTLQSVVRETSDAAHVLKALENASKSYSGKLALNRKWFFDSGKTLTNLVFAAYVNDDTAMNADLSKVRELIKTAPPQVSTEILASLNNFTKSFAAETFTEKDYAAVMKGAIELVETINA